MVNIRTKGATGERDVIGLLEPIVRNVMARHGVVPPEKPILQRNQNQSAVGGSDITNPLGLCIEVKRQEQLAINTWWKQCMTAATESGDYPVLVYRQSGKKWRCITLAWLPLGKVASTQIQIRVEMDLDAFLLWFENWCITRYRVA